MLRLYAPAAVAAGIIAVITFFEWKNQDFLTSSSMTAAEFGKRFEQVPMQVGPWIGQDLPITKDTIEQAGAVNHVSRRYVNEQNQRFVDLWLIVGHSRDIVRHTPDICYPSQGFGQTGSTIKQRIDVEGEPSATFNTAKFHSESGFGSPWERVFWAWNANTEGEKDWVAPDKQRMHFGNNTALYKMYFTSAMSNKDEQAADSTALEFAELMLPHVNRALFPEKYADEAKADAEAEADASAAADEAAESAPDAEEPAAEPAAN